MEATAAARHRARNLRARRDLEPARLLEEAAEFAGEIAQHLAGIVQRLAEAAEAGKPIDAEVRAFRAAADTAVAAATAPPATDVLPLRRAPVSRVRVLSALLTAFDLADAGQERGDVAEYLRTRHRELGDGLLDAIVSLAFAPAS